MFYTYEALRLCNKTIFLVISWLSNYAFNVYIKVNRSTLFHMNSFYMTYDLLYI